MTQKQRPFKQHADVAEVRGPRGSPKIIISGLVNKGPSPVNELNCSSVLLESLRGSKGTPIFVCGGFSRAMKEMDGRRRIYRAQFQFKPLFTLHHS